MPPRIGSGPSFADQLLLDAAVDIRQNPEEARAGAPQKTAQAATDRKAIVAA